MDNLELYNRVRVVPDSAKKAIQAGRMKGFTDINPMWRIKTLTEEFGPCGSGWYFTVLNRWIEKEGGEAAAFVEIELYVKYAEEWSKPIYGIGGSKLASKEKGGVYVSDECFKMATTDALSVACKHLGIGADVYFDKDSTKYSTQNGEKKEDAGNIKKAGKQKKSDLLDLIDRKGMDMRRVLYTYRVKSVDDLSETDCDDAIKKLKALQDKPLPCPDVPEEPEDDPGLPFN